MAKAIAKNSTPKKKSTELKFGLTGSRAGHSPTKKAAPQKKVDPLLGKGGGKGGAKPPITSADTKKAAPKKAVKKVVPKKKAINQRLGNGGKKS